MRTEPLQGVIKHLDLLQEVFLDLNVPVEVDEDADEHPQDPF